MHQRSLTHDYHGRGIYLITLCTEGRHPLLGRLTGSSPTEAAIEPSPLGREVLRCWEQIPAIQRQLAEKKAAMTGQPCVRDIHIIAQQLMPDHFHGIIFVKQEMDISLGDVIRGFMVGCTKAFNAGATIMPQLCSTPSPAPEAPAAPSLASSPANSLTPKSLSTNSPTPPSPPSHHSSPTSTPAAQMVGCSAYSRENHPPLPLWERGYHDRLLTHEGQLQNMIDYVRDNPRRLMLRRLHRDLFLVQRGVHFGQWHFSAIGQVRLLDAPLMAVHVRRYFTEEQRRAYMNSCILAARQGAVLISPFISSYEKRVRDEAFREGLFCIQLCAEPFSDYHKPQGELITPCAEGHLLLLTLATGLAHECRITRDECSSLNAVAESMARQRPTVAP
ncbi:MAG: hypothetical protein K6C30_09040 [Bacteroidaceae bacterium]|nr:hypothetical protein [Bacteroidaceae bacterium]